jgi:hypothetical protein
MTRKKNTPGKNFENFDIDVNEFLNKNTSDWRIQAEKENKKKLDLEEE